MNILHMGSRLLNMTSPVVLLATGAAVVLSLPLMRRGLKTTAVLATRGALAMSDQVRDFSSRVREEAKDIVAEAKAEVPEDGISEVTDNLKQQGRKIAVSVASGALAVTDKAKSIRNECQDIIEDARQIRRNKTGKNEKNDVKTES